MPEVTSPSTKQKKTGGNSGDFCSIPPKNLTGYRYNTVDGGQAGKLVGRVQNTINPWKNKHESHSPNGHPFKKGSSKNVLKKQRKFQENPRCLKDSQDTNLYFLLVQIKSTLFARKKHLKSNLQGGFFSQRFVIEPWMSVPSFRRDDFSVKKKLLPQTGRQFPSPVRTSQCSPGLCACHLLRNCGKRHWMCQILKEQALLKQ